MLGSAWAIINPLAMILVYTLIFTNLMKARLPGTENEFSYSIYLCSGILTWGFFSETLSRTCNIFIENANLIKKINFPRICLPITAALSSLVNFSIVFVLFILFLIVTNNFPGWSFLSFFPTLFVQLIFSIGLGVTLGLLNVFFRDIGQLLGVSLQFWFWLTPIVYLDSILPEQILKIVELNPLTPLVKAYHLIFIYNEHPDASSLIPTAAIGLLLCYSGVYLYKRCAGEMVDEL